MRSALRQLRRLLAEASATAPASPLVALTVPAPARSPLELLGWAVPGSALWWEPPEGDREWAISGRGEVLQLEARGARRFTRLSNDARAAFAGLSERRLGECEAAPVRFFGGLSFAPGAADEAPWQGFGDGCFWLPRLSYGCRGEAAFLRLVVRARELARPEKLQAELDAALPSAALPATPPSCFGPSGAAAYQAAVRRALDAFQSGALRKVVLSRRSGLRFSDPVDPRPALRSLRSRHPDAFRFALQRGPAIFFGATPERLLERSGRKLRCEALAGTLARNGQRNPRSLLESDKDGREHQLVRDDILEALAPFARPDAPLGPPRARAQRGLWHLWTPMELALRKPAHVLELAQALHPTAAVCGTPRRKAARWLAKNEPAPRGWYSGPIGWFDAAGDGVLAVALRCAVIRRQQAFLYAGAGLVEGSEPARELAETALKQTVVLEALGVSS